MFVQPITDLMTSAFGNVWNKYVSNAPGVWDQMYNRNYSNKMDSEDQQARNYMLGGILSSSSIARPRVLDVGCGNGALLKIIGPQDVEYLGLDVSTKAVEAARRKWAETYPDTKFEVGDFSSLQTSQKFDFVIFNEVLYYFPLEAVESTLRKAQGLLDERGEVLISMSANPKARWIWRRCLNVLEPRFELYVASGRWRAWRVKAFHRHSKRDLPVAVVAG